MTTTYLHLLVWVASAALGFGTYDQLIKPCILWGICYLRDSIIERRKAATKRQIERGIRQTWGEYGVGVPYIVISRSLAPAWKGRTAFQKGVAKALEDIREIENGK